MVSTIGLYKTELIELNPPTWTGSAEVETATAGWVQWFNTDRLHSSINYHPPITYEQSELQAMVLDVEMRGRVLAIAAKRIEANQRSDQPDHELIARSERNRALMEARDAERERRRKLAEDIAFD